MCKQCEKTTVLLQEILYFKSMEKYAGFLLLYLFLVVTLDYAMVMDYG